MSNKKTRHRLGLLMLICPGIALACLAILADVSRGGDLISGWGGGQTLLLVFGVMTLVLGWLIHCKAVADQVKRGRPYRRTVAFIVLPIVVLVVGPLALAEGVTRMLQKPVEPAGSYRHHDAEFGFALVPNRQFRVISRPKQFDIRIRIDEKGFRCGPDEQRVDVAMADIAIVGDSHAFGFCVDEDETLAVQLEKIVSQNGGSLRALNAGVPGFGIGQSLLRIESLTQLRSDATIVLFVNPLNDLVNLSSAVEYHFPKPHAVLDSDGQLVFLPRSEHWGDGACWFSPPFDSLNQYFGLSDQQLYYGSALLRRIAVRDKQPTSQQDVVVLEDETSTDQFKSNELEIDERELRVYASRYWPAMSRFATERSELSRLTTAVFQRMKDIADQRQLHLMVIVAPEADEFQTYSKNFRASIQSRWPADQIELGWSRKTVLESLHESGVSFVAPDYHSEQHRDLDLDSLFIPCDSHTSAKGHALIAQELYQALNAKQWLPVPPGSPTADPKTANR